MNFTAISLWVLSFLTNFNCNSTLKMNDKSNILQNITSEVCDSGKFYFNPINANNYYIGSRLHLFWDDYSWAIVFETITYSSVGLNNELCWFSSGNTKSKVLNSEINLISKTKITDREVSILFNNNTILPATHGNLTINDKSVNIPESEIISEYLHNVTPNYRKDNLVYKDDLFRYLIDTIPNDLFLSPMQLTKELDTALPLVKTFNEWHYDEFNCYDGIFGTEPSNSPQMKLVEEMISTMNQHLSGDTIEPNSHWKYWLGY